MSSIRVLPVTEHRRARWRNGLGWTTQIHAEPSDLDWSWRLSLAESDATAAFSSFPEVDRELILVSGSGLRLTSPGAAAVTLRSGQSHRFAGEQEVEGEPLGGPTRQLNVMWRRQGLSAAVTLHHSPESLTLPGDAGAQVAVHAIAGGAAIEVVDDTAELHQGETALVDGPTGPVVIRLTGVGVLAVVQLSATR
ncbi:HutD family protein [Nocardioides sp. W7]|uniref:HutD/Ves family protein n=1 Tax=Nocardioides sp. W7 TaxID=2931390 RepID=UPI001FD39BF8|nr:HutD family protein [Nocardioides sp. W7]